MNVREFNLWSSGKQLVLNKLLAVVKSMATETRRGLTSRMFVVFCSSIRAWSGFCSQVEPALKIRRKGIDSKKYQHNSTQANLQYTVGSEVLPVTSEWTH